MERIGTLLDKIRELNKPNVATIDVDLMIDYTKVIYADLLEYRNKIAFNENVIIKENIVAATSEQVKIVPSNPNVVHFPPVTRQPHSDFEVIESALLNNQPPRAKNKPAVIINEPTKEDYQPSIIHNEPSRVENPQTVMSNEDFPIVNERPIINNEPLHSDIPLSRVDYQTPVINNQPPPRFKDFDIRQHIGINDKYLFISELFNNDKEAYDEVINEINTFDTEEETVTWLNNNVYSQYQWKEDTDVLQAFYKSINDFFNFR